MKRVVITDSDFGRGEIEGAELGADFDIRFLDAREGPALLEGIREADALMVQWARIDGEVLDAAPRLRGIVRFGMGLDNIDLAAAAARGVDVRNVDDFCIDEVADHTTAMVVAGNRRLWLTDRAVKTGAWGPALVPAPRPPSDEAVGIAGFGRIGRAVAERLHLLGYRIAYWDPFDPPAVPDWARRCHTLTELAGASQHLALHMPLTQDTRHIIGEEVLAALGPDGHLINTGRGGLVDEPALLAALDSGALSIASLDVFDVEPPRGEGTSLALAQHPRVLATPHVAYLSTQAVVTLRRHAAQRVKAILT